MIRNLKTMAVSPQPKSNSSVTWAVRKRKRSVPHLSRKFYHFVSGILCFGLYAFVLTRTQALFALGTIGGALVLLDVGRLYFPQLNRFGLWLFGAFMRREELKSLTGNSFFILGLLFIVLLFPKPIVLMSVLFLAVGDPAAAVVGSRWGQTKLWKGKSLEGALANFVATSIASFLAGQLYFQLTVRDSFILALVGGTVSMIAELVPLPIDDNLTIPVLSASLLTLVLAFLPLI